ncbi:hypothetical protein MHYP_G00302960 [Metynnis hypsauchen]
MPTCLAIDSLSHGVELAILAGTRPSSPGAASVAVREVSGIEWHRQSIISVSYHATSTPASPAARVHPSIRLSILLSS